MYISYDEQYKKYGSPAQFNTLDSMLHLAISVLLENTSYVQCCVSDIIVHQWRNKKRKVSTKYKWKDLVNKCTLFCSIPTIDNFVSMKLDRGYTISILRSFIKHSVKYEKIYLKSLRNHKLYFKNKSILNYYLRISAKNTELIQVIETIKFLIKNINRHIELIFFAYGAYRDNLAKKEVDKLKSKRLIELKDLKQNFNRAAIKSIYHFNLDKGTYGPYMGNWLKKALYSNDNYVGNAYDLPQGGYKKRVDNKNAYSLKNIAVELPENYSEQTSYSYDDLEINPVYVKIVKLVDPDNLCKLW